VKTKIATIKFVKTKIATIKFVKPFLFATVTATVLRAPPSSIQCRHNEGLVLDKVYFKRGDFIVLLDYERRLS
jgi:hypothetical protein